MDYVRLNTAGRKPAREPKPIAPGLVSDDNALDFPIALPTFIKPTIYEG
jgi:hypothetical protein